MLGLDPHKSDSASIDDSKPAVAKLTDTGVIESFRAMQHEGLGKGRACPWVLERIRSHPYIGPFLTS